MKCELFRNGTKIAGPIEYDLSVIRELVARQGANPQYVPQQLDTAVDVDGVIIKPVREVKPALGRFETYVKTVRHESDEAVTLVYSKGTKSIDAIKETLVGVLSALHDAYEAERFEYKEVLILADLEARLNAKVILDEYRAGTEVAPFFWRAKVVEGEVEVGTAPVLTNARLEIRTKADMEALYAAINGRITRAFRTKSEIEDQIEAANTVEELAALNVAQLFAQGTAV